MGRSRKPLGDGCKVHARGVREAHPRAARRKGALQREDVREGGGDQAGGGGVRRVEQAAARGRGEVGRVGGAQLGERGGRAERRLEVFVWQGVKWCALGALSLDDTLARAVRRSGRRESAPHPPLRLLIYIYAVAKIRIYIYIYILKTACSSCQQAPQT